MIGVNAWKIGSRFGLAVHCLETLDTDTAVRFLLEATEHYSAHKPDEAG